MALADYKELIGSLAGICTIASFFSGGFICKDIIKRGRIQGESVMPFLCGFYIGLIMFKYGLILNDPAMMPVNIAGLTLNTLYLLCFYIYSENKAEIRTQMVKGAVIAGAILIYGELESEELIEDRFGFIVTVAMMFMVSSPLFSLKEIIETKNTESLPFPIIVSTLVVSSLWGLYGIILDNAFIQFQNAIMIIISLLQLLLFVIFPSKPTDKKKKK